MPETEKSKEYNAESIKVLEGLQGVRKRFDVIELSRKIKKRGDVYILSKELKIKPRALYAVLEEQRVLSLFPKINKSKANILSRLKTNRELKIFSQENDVSALPVRKLAVLVKLWNNNIQINPLIILSNEEHEIILGTLLGDASIRQRDKNSCLRIAHSLKQRDYLTSIKNKFADFEIAEFSQRTRIINNRKVDMIHFSTKTHPIFNYYRKLFYKNSRKIVSEEILNQLNPRSLAFWVCDDGSYDNRQGYIILCTNAYNLEEHQLMKKFFNDKFGLDPTIGFRDKKYYYLRFKKEDSKKLINIIKPFIPESMKYKIGEKNG